MEYQQVESIGKARVISLYNSTDNDNNDDSLQINEIVDIFRREGLWSFVSNGSFAGYFPTSCLEELSEKDISVSDSSSIDSSDDTIPEGWHLIMSSKNVPYYFHAATGLTQWNRPESSNSLIIEPESTPKRSSKKTIPTETSNEIKINFTSANIQKSTYDKNEEKILSGAIENEVTKPKRAPRPPSSAPPQDAALPAGWLAATSDQGFTYYYNENTGKTQWERPLPPLVIEDDKEEVEGKNAPPLAPVTPVSHHTLSTSHPPLGFDNRASNKIIKAPTITTANNHNNPQPPLPPRTPSTSRASTTATMVTPANAVRRPSLPPPDNSSPIDSLASSGTQSLRIVSKEISKKRHSNRKVQGELLQQSLQPLRVFRLPYELQQEILQFSLSGFASRYFNIRRRRWRFFLRGSDAGSVDPSLTCHSKSPLSTSLTRLKGNGVKVALRLFHRILVYMGDDGAQKPPEEEYLEMELTNIMLEVQKHGDDMTIEVMCQLAKQTAENPGLLSLERGWELLLATALCFETHAELAIALCHHAATQRTRVDAIGGLALCVYDYLLRGLQQNRAVDYPPPRVPPSEIRRSVHIEPLKKYTAPDKNLFGLSLESLVLREILERHPDSLLPLPSRLRNTETVPEILVLLCSAIFRLGGKKKSGLFREAADVDDVRRVVAQLDSGGVGITRKVLGDAGGSRISSRFYHVRAVTDVLVVCDLLKMLLRKMPEPLVPYSVYQRCVDAGNRSDREAAQEILNDIIPLHRASLRYLCSFLRELSVHSQTTRMEIGSLCLVFVPNCIKNPSKDMMTYAMTLSANADAEMRCLQLFVDVLAPTT